MRRLVRLPTGARFLWLAGLMYVVIRSAAAWGRVAAVFPDTPGWETLAFRGVNARFWPVPLAFHLVSGAGARVVLHVAVGTAAWMGLASVITRRSRFPRAVATAVLIVGLTPQVVRWDLAMLSESLGISFAVAAVTATLWMTESPSVVSRLTWLASVVLCSMTRPTHLIVLVVCAVGAIVVAASTRGRRTAVASVVLAALSVWGVGLLSGNRATSDLNLYTVLAERVVTSDSRYAWFTANGMPDIPGVRAAEGYDYVGDLPADLAAIVQLPVGQQPPAIIRAGGLPLARWVRSHGWRTYARFVATHPSDTWMRLSSLASATIDPPNDDFLPLNSRSIVPRALFTKWWLWSWVGAAAIAAGLARPGGGRTSRALVAMTVTTATVWAATLLTSGIEHQRHAATTAVLLRVLTLAAAANLTAVGGEHAARGPRDRFADQPG